MNERAPVVGFKLNSQSSRHSISAKQSPRSALASNADQTPVASIMNNKRRLQLEAEQMARLTQMPTQTFKFGGPKSKNNGSFLRSSVSIEPS